MYCLDFKVGDIITLYSYNDGTPKVISGIVVGDRFKYDVPEWIIETNERTRFFPKASKSSSLVGGRGILKGRFTVDEFIEAVKNETK